MALSDQRAVGRIVEVGRDDGDNEMKRWRIKERQEQGRVVVGGVETRQLAVGRGVCPYARATHLASLQPSSLMASLAAAAASAPTTTEKETHYLLHFAQGSG